jgi:Sulfotransferase family
VAVSDEDGRHDGPIFVVGSMRSGSTLLRLILDSHPRIAVGAETGFMGAVSSTKRIPNWKYGAEWYERINWSEAELDERLRDFYSGMFARYAAERGKARWGEKTPFHTEHMSTMAEIFPSSVFVGLVRHPGAVASSLRASFHYTFAEALDYWTATNLAMVEGGRSLGDRFVLCRYEDLVTDAEPVLREVMSTVGEEFSPDLLRHHDVQQLQGAPRVVEGSTNTRDPVDARRAHRWTENLTTDDRLALERTGQLAGFFGYSRLDVGAGVPWGAPSGRKWTLTGGDVADRRDRWRDRIDFGNPPPAPLVDADPAELARRLAHVEAVLTRVRSRRAVRLAEAVRGLQHGRSWADLRGVWEALRRDNRPSRNSR